MAKSNSKNARNANEKNSVRLGNNKTQKKAAFSTVDSKEKSSNKKTQKQLKLIEKNSKKRAKLEAKLRQEKIASEALSQSFSKQKLVNEHKQSLQNYLDAKKALKATRIDQAKEFKKARENEREQYKQELKLLSKAEKETSQNFRKRKKEIQEKFKAAKHAKYDSPKKRRAAILEARRERKIARVQNQDLRKQELINVKENAVKFRNRHQAALLEQDTKRIQQYELFLQAYNTEIKGSHIRYLNSKKRLGRVEKEAALRLKEKRMLNDEVIRKERFRTHVSKLTPDEAAKLAKNEAHHEKNFQNRLKKLRAKIAKYNRLNKEIDLKNVKALSAFDTELANQIKSMNAAEKAAAAKQAKLVKNRLNEAKRKEKRKAAKLARKERKKAAKIRRQEQKQAAKLRKENAKARAKQLKVEAKIKRQQQKQAAKIKNKAQLQTVKIQTKKAANTSKINAHKQQKVNKLNAKEQRLEAKRQKREAKIAKRDAIIAKKKAEAEKRRKAKIAKRNAKITLKKQKASEKKLRTTQKAQLNTKNLDIERADSKKVEKAFDGIVGKDAGSSIKIEKLRFARRSLLNALSKINQKIANLSNAKKDQIDTDKIRADLNVDKTKLVKKERQLAYKIAKLEAKLAWNDEQVRFAKARKTLSNWETKELKSRLDAKHEWDLKKLADLRSYVSKKKRVGKLQDALMGVSFADYEEASANKTNSRIKPTKTQLGYIQAKDESKIITQEVNESILSAKLAIKEAKKQVRLEAKELRLKQKRQAEQARIAKVKALQTAKQKRLDEIAAKRKAEKEAQLEVINKKQAEKAALRAEILQKRQQQLKIRQEQLQKRQAEKLAAKKAREEKLAQIKAKKLEQKAAAKKAHEVRLEKLQAQKALKRAELLKKRQAKKEAIIKQRELRLEAIAKKKAARRRLEQGYENDETLKLANANLSRQAKIDARRKARLAKAEQAKKQREHLKTLSGFERKEYLIQVKEQAKLDRLVRKGETERAKQLQFIYDMRRKYRLETEKGIITAKQAKIELSRITKEQLVPSKYVKVGTDGIMDSEKRLSVFVPRAITTIREWMRVMAIVSTTVLAAFILLILVDYISNSTFIVIARPDDQQYLTVLGFCLFSAIFIVSLVNSIVLLILACQVKSLKIMRFTLMFIAILALVFMLLLALFIIIDKASDSNIIINQTFDNINAMFTNFGVCMIALTFISFCCVCASMLAIIPFMSKLLTEKMNLGDRLSVLNMSYKDAINYANRLKHDMQVKRDALELESQEILANIKKLEEMNKMKMFERRLREQLQKQEFIDKVAQMFISEHEEFMNLFAAKNGKDFRQLKRTIIKNLREYRYQQIVGQIEDAIAAREKTSKQMQARVLREGDIKMAFNMFNSAYDIYESDMKKHPNESDFDRFMRLKRGNLTEEQFRALKKELEQEYYSSIKPMTNVTDSTMHTESMKAREYALKPAIFDEKVEKFSYDPLDPTNQAEEIYAIMDGYYPEADINQKKVKAQKKRSK